MEELYENSNDIIIAGDFNIDWQSDFYKSKLESLLNDNGLKRIMKEFTRITKNSKTLIDYIITNNEILSAKNNTNNKITDHECIDIFIENGKVRENNNNKWFSNELRMLKMEKIIKYQKGVYENSASAWIAINSSETYIKLKLVMKKISLQAIKSRILATKNEMWYKIKELVLKTPQKCDQVIKSVIFNNIEYNINSEIAENFNNYFVDSIKDIRCSIDDVQYKNQIPVINCRFKFRVISLLELRNICKTIKKNNDYRRISNNLILDNWDLVGNILLEIINKSLETGIFPDNWKKSMLTPIEKIKNTNKCEEFHPINSLKTFEKVLETVVKQQLENYMEENKLLSKYQSGFRRKFSCKTFC